jgi:hypothetical protein
MGLELDIILSVPHGERTLMQDKKKRRTFFPQTTSRQEKSPNLSLLEKLKLPHVIQVKKSSSLSRALWWAFVLVVMQCLV